VTRDSGRSRFYETERLALDMVERAGTAGHTVQLAGTTLTLPVEARFGSVDAVQDYADRVLALASVRERFPRAQTPITVRRRRSGAAAHYSPERGEIAVPDDVDGRWALRELVILHEVAHHLNDDDGPPHGRAYANILVDLVGLVLGPELALVYRVLLGDADLL